MLHDLFRLLSIVPLSVPFHVQGTVGMDELLAEIRELKAAQGKALARIETREAEKQKLRLVIRGR